MFSAQELKLHCNNRTMQRAAEIARADVDIQGKRVRYDRTKTVLSAFVASSSDSLERYRVQVSFDANNGRIDDYSCTCPAYYKYDGMCKHCVALALSYLHAPERFTGYRANALPSTSNSLLELMERTRATQAQTSEDSQPIHIEPTFSYGYQQWQVRFTIAGPQGTYVLRDVFQFAQLMKTGGVHQYGKNLEFAHVPQAFDARSRALAAFLEKAAATRQHTATRSAWGARAQSPALRTLELSDYELVELLDIMGTDTFVVEGTDFGMRAKTRAHVVNADPDIDVRLAQAEGEGFTLHASQELVLIAHGGRLFVWLDDVFYRCSEEFSAHAALLEALCAPDAQELFVSTADMPLFCATVLPELEANLQVALPETVEAYRPVPCALEFYFDRTKEQVTCRVLAVYGSVSHALLDPQDASLASRATQDEPGEQTASPLRDEQLEQRAISLVAHYFSHTAFADDAPDGEQGVQAFIPMTDEQGVADLIFGGLTQFQNLGAAYTTPAFDSLLSDRKPHVSMGLSLAGNLINLTVSAQDMPAEELGALLTSYRARKRFHRLKSGVYLDIAALDLAQLDRIATDLEISAKDLQGGVVELPAYRAFYLDDQLDAAQRDGAFMRYVEQFHTLDQADYVPPALATGTLRPYQVEGFRWLSALCDLGFGGILADEMGLGKSVQLISFLLSRVRDIRETGPVLIACPASLVYNWEAECARFAPQLRVVPIAGTKQERMTARATEGVDVFVTSYDLMRIDVAQWAALDLYCFVLDEAQYIKNHGTQTARAAKRIQARHRFALTGTPMENRLSEIWSIFDFLMPGFLGSYMRFRERFELDIIGGDESVADRLRALVGPFMLRRLKADVLTDLPDKLEQIVYAPLGKEQRRLYDAHEQHLREELTRQRQMRKQRALDKAAGKPVSDVEVLAELTKLRQICCDPRLLFDNYKGHGAKIDAIMDLVESCIDGGQKMLIFSQFTSFLSLIESSLDGQGIPYFEITGATPKQQRVKLVETFNADETPVFLVSLKAGGTGLNLTGASVVVHADPWWNAAAQNQATDRAHRIGQTKVVSVHKVIAQGTIEERIVNLQDMKSELASQIIGGEGMSLSALTKDDLLELLQG